MYKLYALVFFSLPVILVVVYGLNPTFFFGNTFFPYYLLVLVLAYGSFIFYIIGSTFLAVRNDTALARGATKLVNWLKWPFLKISLITNGVAFIWVMFLTIATGALLVFALGKMITAWYPDQLVGLINNLSGSQHKQAALYDQVKFAADKVDFLTKSFDEQQKDTFLSNNKLDYEDSDESFTYKIEYSPNYNLAIDEVSPTYMYSLTICDYSQDDNGRCAYGYQGVTNFRVFQNETISAIKAKAYEFSGLSDRAESLHKIALITNKRTVELFVVFNPDSAEFSMADDVTDLNKNEDLTYDLAERGTGYMNFSYTKNLNGKQYQVGSRIFTIDLISETIH